MNPEKVKYLKQKWVLVYLSKFLLDNNTSLEKFLKNCIEQNDAQSVKRVLFDRPIDCASNIIDYSFTWSETPEGGHFWCVLDTKFCNSFPKDYGDFVDKLNEHNIR